MTRVWHSYDKGLETVVPKAWHRRAKGMAQERSLLLLSFIYIASTHSLRSPFGKTHFNNKYTSKAASFLLEAASHYHIFSL